MKKQNTIAMCAFSADPITFGHINIVERASKIFDKVIVGIGINPDKNYKFDIEQRTEMAKKSLLQFSNVEVVSFTGLLVDYAYEMGVDVIIKGIRNSVDFDYENVLYQIGESQKRGIETYVLMAKPELSHISSSAVKEIHKSQGTVHEYVPLFVKQSLEKKSGKYIIGITGEIGVGKSYVANKFVEFGKKYNIEVHNIDLDIIGHQILGILQEPVYKNVRKEIVEIFGRDVEEIDGSINRQILGEIVFNDSKKLDILNSLMETPILVRLQRELANKSGLIIINAALISESNMAYLSNNNVVLISAEKEVQKRRLISRNFNEEQIKTRFETQFNYEKKYENLEKIIKNENHGKIWEIDNSIENNDEKIEELFNEVIKVIF